MDTDCHRFDNSRCLRSFCVKQWHINLVSKLCRIYAGSLGIHFYRWLYIRPVFINQISKSPGIVESKPLDRVQCVGFFGSYIYNRHGDEFCLASST